MTWLVDNGRDQTVDTTWCTVDGCWHLPRPHTLNRGLIYSITRIDRISIMSNDLVLREFRMGQVTRIVQERRLRLYGHAPVPDLT